MFDLPRGEQTQTPFNYFRLKKTPYINNQFLILYLNFKQNHNI